jgi:hypothetical protein
VPRLQLHSNGLLLTMILLPDDFPKRHSDPDELWAGLHPRIEALLQRKVDAMQRRVEARLVKTLGRQLTDVYNRLEPMVRQTVKHKNDVQDDAILGIGAKVDAQEQAIHDLADHVRKMLSHPLFRR